MKIAIKQKDLRNANSFCYQCGHSITHHAFYSSLDGHLVMDYDTLVLKGFWFGMEVIVELPAPYIKARCYCKRFVSKKEFEQDQETNNGKRQMS